MSSEVIIPTVAQIDHDKVESAKLKRSNETGEIVLDMPMETISGDKLPEITIITITRDRKRFSSLMIDNWKRVYYPTNKIFWLIVDDSDDVRQGPVLEIKALKDDRISYYYLQPKEEIITETDGSKTVKKSGHTVGYKRNFAMGLVKTDIVAMVDDDDFLYKESILARACCLMFYEKQCVYSSEIAVYNMRHESSYILEGFDDVPEGTLMFTRKFWDKQKFGEGARGEGIQLVSGQELYMLRIHWMFNLIVLNHSSNTTGSGRDVRFKMIGKLKNKAAINAPLNFFKIFPESYQKALKILKK